MSKGIIDKFLEELKAFKQSPSCTNQRLYGDAYDLRRDLASLNIYTHAEFPGPPPPSPPPPPAHDFSRQRYGEFDKLSDLDWISKRHEELLQWRKENEETVKVSDRWRESVRQYMEIMKTRVFEWEEQRQESLKAFYDEVNIESKKAEKSEAHEDHEEHDE